VLNKFDKSDQKKLRVAYDCHQPSFQLTLNHVNAVLITSPELYRQGVKLRMRFHVDIDVSKPYWFRRERE
jgi:hypothetical protein